MHSTHSSPIGNPMMHASVWGEGESCNQSGLVQKSQPHMGHKLACQKSAKSMASDPDGSGKEFGQKGRDATGNQMVLVMCC